MSKEELIKVLEEMKKEKINRWGIDYPRFCEYTLEEVIKRIKEA